LHGESVKCAVGGGGGGVRRGVELLVVRGLRYAHRRRRERRCLEGGHPAS